MKQSESKITYTERDGILYPDLAIFEQTDYPYGKYGQRRLNFFEEALQRHLYRPFDDVQIERTS